MNTFRLSSHVSQLSWDLGHNMGVINDLIVGYYFFNETGNTTAAQNNLVSSRISLSLSNTL